MKLTLYVSVELFLLLKKKMYLVSFINFGEKILSKQVHGVIREHITLYKKPYTFINFQVFSCHHVHFDLHLYSGMQSTYVQLGLHSYFKDQGGRCIDLTNFFQLSSFQRILLRTDGRLESCTVFILLHYLQLQFQ